jgi:hypothetical protein
MLHVRAGKLRDAVARVQVDRVGKDRACDSQFRSPLEIPPARFTVDRQYAAHFMADLLRLTNVSA